MTMSRLYVHRCINTEKYTCRIVGIFGERRQRIPETETGTGDGNGSDTLKTENHGPRPMPFIKFSRFPPCHSLSLLSVSALRSPFKIQISVPED
jgi:hypothetical protein